ncbi:ribosomal protein S5 domain 2-like protein [Ascobolus immersus RN42]|uniref:Ribosomal RNA-processing protein 41 n=1 Tax=Ascobolus immersus RN42 TaxID=1160509 RepID=A0A3N4I3Y9_ASCIM|nr:ribosomal protein S5 domain 2-like protein [Ascobolus immersus RN42]
MSRYELLSPEGLRIDGRRWNDLRRVFAQMATQPSSNGSSYFEMGNTKVICTIQGPGEPTSRSKTIHDRCSISVDLNYAPFSGIDRKRRGRGDKRTVEMQTSLENTFAQAIRTTLLARSEIIISLHILSQDGSVLAACINATTLALIDAGIPLTDYLVACTSGSSSSYSTQNDEDADPLLDVNSLEENDLPCLTVATLGATDKVVLLLMENKVNVEKLEEMLAVGIDGCKTMRRILDTTVRKHGKELLEKREQLR